MPKRDEQRARRAADRKGLKGERRRRYIYGTMRQIERNRRRKRRRRR